MCSMPIPSPVPPQTSHTCPTYISPKDSPGSSFRTPARFNRRLSCLTLLGVAKDYPSFPASKARHARATATSPSKSLPASQAPSSKGASW